ncbi:MAG: multidrug effflux MFS transporter [Alphaproteobacteria bacterium]|nr:multidrug effflux MFS transporter [Alphaproteobacteria bacterium]
MEQVEDSYSCVGVGKERQTKTLLLILSTLPAFGPLATDMYLSAFPVLVEYFHTEISLVAQSLSLYFLGLAGGQLLYGPLADRFGRKPVLLVGIALFISTSFLIVFVPSIRGFIALRFFQAVGGCSGMLIARAVVSDLYKEREAARFFSLMMIVAALAPIAAPALGGYLVAFVGWKSVFVFLTAFGIFCFVMVKVWLPETLRHDAQRSLSFGETAKTYGRLLARRHFILPSLVCAVSFGELFAFISGSPFVYMHLHGVSTEHYGLLFAANAVGMTVASKINHSLLRYMSPIRLLWGGVAANFIFCLVLFLFAEEASLPFLFSLFLLALFVVPAIGANATAVAMAACSDRKGSASGLLGVLQFSLASLASTAVGHFHNETVYPVTGVILGCSFAALIMLFFDLVRPSGACRNL